METMKRRTRTTYDWSLSENTLKGQGRFDLLNVQVEAAGNQVMVRLFFPADKSAGQWQHEVREALLGTGSVGRGCGNGASTKYVDLAFRRQLEPSLAAILRVVTVIFDELGVPRDRLLNFESRTLVELKVPEVGWRLEWLVLRDEIYSLLGITD